MPNLSVFLKRNETKVKTNAAFVDSALASFCTAVSIIGTWDLLLVNPDGQEALEQNAVLIYEEQQIPTAAQVNPNFARQNQQADVEIGGTGFSKLVAFYLEYKLHSVQVTNVTILNSTFAKGTVKMPDNADLGAWTLVPKDQFGNGVPLNEAFNVLNQYEKPSIYGISETVGIVG